MQNAERQSQVQQQMLAQQQARIDDLIIGMGREIFTALIVQSGVPASGAADVEQIRNLAKYSVTVAPYFAEALGIARIVQNPETNSNASEKHDASPGSGTESSAPTEADATVVAQDESTRPIRD